MNLARRKSEPPPLSSVVRREILLELLMAEKTFAKVLSGKPVRDASRERVRRALEARGLLHLLPPEPGPTKAA